MLALPYSITISDEERAYLKSLIKARTIQAQIVDRARMLLWKSEAKTDKAIADGLGISVNTVRRCIDRYLSSGINLAIFDDERSGRPVEITDDAKSWIVSIACQKPCNLGYAAELWTLAALYKHIQAHAEEAGYPRLKTVTKPWLQKYLKKMDIKPFKITRQFLAALPEDRFVFVFTPTHASWLNMIESFFSKMTKQMLKGIRVNSKEELSERIYRYFDEINVNPIVYHWTYKMDEINPDEIATV